MWLYGLFTIGIPVLLLAFGTLFVYASLNQSNGGPPLWLAIAWLTGALIASIKSLKMPFRIEVMNDGRIKFFSLAGHIEIWPNEIIRIKQGALQAGFIDLKHSRGRIRMLHQFNGFYEFLHDVKIANPNIEIIGC